MTRTETGYEATCKICGGAWESIGHDESSISATRAWVNRHHNELSQAHIVAAVADILMPVTVSE